MNDGVLGACHWRKRKRKREREKGRGKGRLTVAWSLLALNDGRDNINGRGRRGLGGRE